MLPSLQESVSIFNQERNQAESRYGARRAALRLFRQAYNRGRSRRIWSALKRGDRRLLDLAEALERVEVIARHSIGTRTVPIARIVGSEGRSEDFDADFHPLNPHNDERWIGIAAARLLDAVLPPVELIQIGEDYFVRDGHHRISVAKHSGQEEIEAEVVVWRTEGNSGELRELGGTEGTRGN